MAKENTIHGVNVPQLATLMSRLACCAARMVHFEVLHARLLVKTLEKFVVFMCDSWFVGQRTFCFVTGWKEPP